MKERRLTRTEEAVYMEILKDNGISIAELTIKMEERYNPRICPHYHCYVSGKNECERVCGNGEKRKTDACNRAGRQEYLSGT